jgi:hypothetical protein
MKRKIILDAILYENCVLKAQYNELLSLTSKLEADNNKLKNQINKPDNHYSNTIFTLNETNQNITNELSDLSKKSVIMIENRSTAIMPLFQISKYCSSVNNFSHLNDKTDTISELTMDP